MGPIGAFHENVRQQRRHQWLGCLLIKKSNGVDRQKRLGGFRPFLFVEQGTRLAFHPAHAGIGIEREHQNIPQGAGLFEEPDVARMQQVVAAVREDHGLTLLFPEGALAHQFVSDIAGSHRYQCSSPTWRNSHPPLSEGNCQLLPELQVSCAREYPTIKRTEMKRSEEHTSELQSLRHLV